VIRPVTEDDVPAVVALLAQEGIREWWGVTPEAEVRELIGSAFVIEVDGELAGWLQYDEETWFQGPRVAFDIAIADAFTGRGIGPAALREAVAHFTARGHHRFTIDPDVTNTRAIRAYEKAGFQPVGVMRKSSRIHREDDFSDDLLMELIAGTP
jgi:aminoglycoside 6'-N-acetyltransferase